MVVKSSDNKSIKNRLPRCTFEDELLISESTSSLNEVRFSKQEFSASKPLSNIKYHYPGS